MLFPPQENYGAFVTSNDAEYPKWFFDNITKKDLSSSIRLHGHTHPFFSTNPSGTDIDQFNGMMSQVDNYMIQLILSNSRPPHCALWTKAKDGTILIHKIKIVWQFEEQMYKVFDKVTQKVKPEIINSIKKTKSKTQSVTIPDKKTHYDLFNLTMDGDA